MVVLLPISLVTAAAVTLVNFWLMMRIGQVRRATKIFIGDDGHEPLVRRMRAQANLVESAPFVLVLLALIELARGSSLALWTVAVVYVIARLLHGLGMDGWRQGRMAGTILSMLVLVGLAVTALIIAVRGAAPVSTGRAVNTYAVPQG